ncbi:hypothetical protein [Microbacterium capsulatum]|uniref:Transcriptional regulator, AbiEi antitoxin, Type IV TA system n=1 Tax=Microbacterium capsulatum TaxID=3041921 RepID=A0ABU0XDM8_9MICO|nr:hypothetical protein [Microbacterium sp. ASV81]MDQ4212295.1 hypothetical protein [Microbacterium sp. ASV81]
MQAATEHPIAVHRRREHEYESPVNDRRLQRLVEDGSQVRIAAGSYVPAAEWNALTPLQRHLTRVIEIADRTRSPQVLTHAAAAAVWGLDRIGPWPDLVEVRIPSASGGRSSGGIRRRALGYDGVDVLPWRGHLVTSPAQTAIDLAAEARFTDGVIAMDQARWSRRDGGALTDRIRIDDVLSGQFRRGLGRVQRVIEFSTELSDSVRESQSRVLIERLGFPVPVLQRTFRLPALGDVRTDFWFDDFDHIGEFDGTGKYLDPTLLAGRSPGEALLAEKDRGDALRRIVRRVSRWRTPALRDPRLLYDILTGDGLPSRLPRPRVGAQW